MAPVLDIENLSTHIKLTSSVVQAVGNIDMRVEAGETLGIVGESGCGKSMTGLSIMGLLPPGGSIVGGSIKLDGRELVGLKQEELRQVRGNEIAMIFQDPLTSLDPTKTIGYQVAEPVRLHRGASKAEALGPGGRGAEPGRAAPAEGAAQRLPAPAVRRPAAARDDRHGAGQRAQAAHRRRADHGARRHHPGADPRPAQGPEGAAGHGHAADHARHGRDRRARRPGQRHVRGPGGGNRRGAPALQRDAPPLHPGPARFHPPARPGRQQGAARHSRPAARPGPSAAGLPVRRQVLPGHGQVPDRGAVPVGQDLRAQVLLLAPGGRAARPGRDRRRAGRTRRAPAWPHRTPRACEEAAAGDKVGLVDDAPLADAPRPASGGSSRPRRGRGNPGSRGHRGGGRPRGDGRRPARGNGAHGRGGRGERERRRPAARAAQPGEGISHHLGRDPAAQGGGRPRRVGRVLLRARRDHVRPGRRVGVRQDHDRQDDRGAGEAELRLGHASAA